MISRPQPHSSNKDTVLWFFILLAAFCYFDLILLGPYAVVNFFDTIDNDFPHFINQGKLLLEHGLFSWYPNNPGGMPSFVSQHPPYALPSLLGAFLPLWLFSLIWNFLSIAMLGYGIFRLLHSFFAISKKSSLLIATFSAFMPLCGNPQFVMSYFFPLFFIWTHELCSDDLGWKGKAARVTGLIAITASSYPVLTLPHFPIFHFFLYLVFGLKRPYPGRNIAAIFMVWTGYVLFFAPSIYSLFEYIPYAQREYTFSNPGIIPLIIAYVDQFVGRLADSAIFPAVLLGLPLLKSSSTLRRCFWFMLIPQAVGVFFGTDTKALLAGTFLIKMDLFLSTTVLGVSQALFAAKSMDIFRKNPRTLKKLWLVAVFLILIPLGNEKTMVQNIFLLGTTLCGIYLFRMDGRTLKRPILILAVFCGCLAGFSMQMRQGTMHESEHILYGKGFDNHPELSILAKESRINPFRVASADMHPSIAQSYGLETIDQRGVLFNKYYKQYFKAIVMPQFVDNPQVETWFDQLWRYMMFTRQNDTKVNRSALILDGPERSAKDWNIPLLLNMNVKYILSSRPITNMEAHSDLEFKAEGEGLPGFLKDSTFNDLYQMQIYAYRLRDSFGLGRLAHKALVLPARSAVIEAMSAMDVTTLQDTVVFMEEDMATPSPLPEATLQRSMPVTVLAYAPDQISFSGTTHGPCYLVVANNYDPRWKATINGKEAVVVQANNAFQAVYIPEAGEFKAVLTFESPIVWWIHIATILGLILIIAVAFLS